MSIAANSRSQQHTSNQGRYSRTGPKENFSLKSQFLVLWHMLEGSDIKDCIA